MNSDAEKVDELEDLKKQLTRRNTEIEIIEKVASQINKTLNLDKIASAMLKNMDSFFGFKHTMILLLDETEQSLKVLATHGYEDQGIGAKVEIGVGVIGMVAKRKKLMRMANMGMQRN